MMGERRAELPQKSIETEFSEKNIRHELLIFLKVVVQLSTAVPFRFSSNKYLCFYCYEDFVESSDLLKHTKDEHEGQNLRYVFRYYPKNPTIKLHITNLSCKRCSQPAKDLNEFVDHAIKNHKCVIDKEILKHVYSYKLSNDELPCLQCGEKFKFFSPLMMHTNKFHNQLTPFLCENCGKAYTTQRAVDEHVKRAHDPNGIFPCKKCKDVFPTSYKLKSHVEKIHKAYRLKCPTCSEAFSSRYTKKRHLATVHNVKECQYPCPECGVVFIDKSTMVYHKNKVHDKEKNVSCHICGFKTFNKSSLKLHLVAHSAERPFECEICKKSFQRKRTLDFHTRIHKDDKRYVCKDCGKAFVQVTSLKVHSRTHHSS